MSNQPQYPLEEVMAMSDATEQFRDRPRRADSDGVPLPRLTRADLILALIPLAFAVAFVVAAASPLALNETLAAASLVGFAGIVESVVVNPPTPER